MLVFVEQVTTCETDGLRTVVVFHTRAFAHAADKQPVGLHRWERPVRKAAGFVRVGAGITN
ncbi:hypothetical protein SDC9_211095 [bioreactor metagenome]|uniref:Uncharacterized protein n=1 Tax=bioreactor metagenome TaxID=1076179 RepID=A0A645JJ18_9ZZZZ